MTDILRHSNNDNEQRKVRAKAKLKNALVGLARCQQIDERLSEGHLKFKKGETVVSLNSANSPNKSIGFFTE